MMRSIVEVIKGWLYLLALVTGGNYVRKAKLQRLGRGAKILPTVFFKYPEMIQIGDELLHQSSVLGMGLSLGARLLSEATCSSAPARRLFPPIME